MPTNSEPEKTSLPEIDKLFASATHFRFPTGAFGKTCMLIAIFATSCAAIAWSASNPWVAAFALLIVGFVTLAALWRLFNFADKNPSAAILEGAEFIKHEQIQLAAKGMPSLPFEGAVSVNEPENVPLIVDATSIGAPDIEGSQESVDGDAR